MKSGSLLARKESREIDLPEPVRILIVYEDMVTGQKARLVAEQLVGSLGPGYRCEPSLWKFEVLKVPDISAMAAYEARQADLIVFAAREGKELEEEVKQWIQGWLPYKERGDSCIVALLLKGPNPTASASPLYSYLRKIAEKRGLDFFWQELESQPDFVHSPNSSSACPMAPVMTPPMEFEPTAVHWGIND